jgi:hypothetical protein
MAVRAAKERSAHNEVVRRAALLAKEDEIAWAQRRAAAQRQQAAEYRNRTKQMEADWAEELADLRVAEAAFEGVLARRMDMLRRVDRGESVNPNDIGGDGGTPNCVVM